MSFEGHHIVIGHEVVMQCGTYSLERYWLAGWHYDLKFGAIELVYGYTGKETMVTVHKVKPVVTIHVS